MSATPPAVSVEPLDERRCTFTLDRPVHDDAVRRFRSATEAAGVPVVEAVLAVPGITEVTVAGRTLTAVKDVAAPWRALADQVLYAIETALAPPHAAPPDQASTGDGDDGMYDLVARLFAEEINPAVARHGGKVELVDVQEGRVVLRMLGGCHGCGMASVTLRQGIESALRQVVPGFVGLTDITDHASGTDPYFAPAAHPG